MPNMEFGRVVNGEIEYAPSYFYDGRTMEVNPTAEKYALHDYYPIAHNHPLEPAADGYHWERINSQVVDGAIYDNYTQVADPPLVHTYSKLRLLAALNARGLWTAFKAFVEAAQLTDAWQLAQDLSSDYDGFADVAEQARIALGVDAETMAEILNEAEVANG